MPRIRYFIWTKCLRWLEREYPGDPLGAIKGTGSLKSVSTGSFVYTGLQAYQEGVGYYPISSLGKPSYAQEFGDFELSVRNVLPKWTELHNYRPNEEQRKLLKEKGFKLSGIPDVTQQFIEEMNGA